MARAATSLSQEARAQLAAEIKTLGREAGFQQIGIARLDLTEDAAHLERWLALGRHGTMSYMSRHGTKRTRPELLVPGTISVISVRLDYWPAGAADPLRVLTDPRRAYVARYAIGRDYHKVMRGKLKRLAARIAERVGAFGHRVFVDSAPVLERALARNAGLGWIGKHTNLIDRHGGSWFFIGELYTDLALPCDRPVSAHCGSCRACLDACPTAAIVGPYELDARRCISYLTIENKGPIPEALRSAIGNRVFGCDDCQLVCPWNRYAQPTAEPDFRPRHDLDDSDLVELFGWTEAQWRQRTEGSALRRAGFDGWLRNIAVALGNAPPSRAIKAALHAKLTAASALVAEHIHWALAQQMRSK
jgi:epoxyqueuosine reductase